MHHSFAWCFFFYLSFLFPPVEPGVFNCCVTNTKPRRVFPPGSLAFYQPISILLDVGTFSSFLGIVRVRTPSLYSPVMSSVLTDETSKLLLNEP